MKHNILSYLWDNLLFFLSLFLIIFIPLYPKWPLFDILPGYNVRIRLEDFFILITSFIWFVQLITKKISLKNNPLAKPIFIYLSIGFLSSLSAIFVTKTIFWDTYQIGKIFLHFFRRIEYFSLYFICFSAIKSPKQLKYYISAIVLAVSLVTIYGIGQKYLYWPAYSTMNREFAKGIRLYLGKDSRVLSTFGGHYDLAAYSMITLTLIIPLLFSAKRIVLKIFLSILSLMVFWLLNLTVSRTSFIAYLISISVVFLLFIYKKGVFWSIKRYLPTMFISLFIAISIGSLAERFAHLFKLQDLKIKVTDFLGSKAPPINGIALRDDISFEEQLKIVATPSDIPPSSQKPGEDNIKPADVEDNIPDYIAVTVGEGKEASTTYQPINRSYSTNALNHGLSVAIRLDVLWPNALKALKTNPILGTGYSTLVKSSVYERTTAESTDCDYLRWLGETGIAGFISFLAIIYFCVVKLFQALKHCSSFFSSSFFIASIGVISGILVNALYIDVFESSKVAYSFWGIMGISLAFAQQELSQKPLLEKVAKRKMIKSVRAVKKPKAIRTK